VWIYAFTSQYIFAAWPVITRTQLPSKTVNLSSCKRRARLQFVPEYTVSTCLIYIVLCLLCHILSTSAHQILFFLDSFHLKLFPPPNRRDDMLMLVSCLIRVGLYSDAVLYLNRCVSLCKDIRCHIYSKSFQ